MNNQTILLRSKVYTWESGIRTANPMTTEFYRNNKEFYAVEEDGRVLLSSIDGEAALRTSLIMNIQKNGRHVRIETRNTTYNLWEQE